MALTTGIKTIRECARELIDIQERYSLDILAGEARAVPIVQHLLERPDLLDLGVRREGNHTPDSLWLYYDFDLLIFTFRTPRGVAVPVHNHGTWEMVGVHQGAVKYTMYKRNDDLSRPYYADLEVVEDRIMVPGEVSLCPPPPHDVHGFTALTDDTYMIAVVGGHYAPTRQYYTPADQYYIERHQQEWRTGKPGGAANL
jgi:predicted metal-dependent enzyme (double-stranded beta helix superfamily)